MSPKRELTWCKLPKVSFTLIPPDREGGAIPRFKSMDWLSAVIKDTNHDEYESIYIRNNKIMYTIAQRGWLVPLLSTSGLGFPSYELGSKLVTASLPLHFMAALS